MEFFNRHTMMDRRRVLRNRSTKHEKILWEELRKRKLNGLKFRRQASVENYVMDFYCPELNLCVELDGTHHLSKEEREYDNERTAVLNSYSITVLRFQNHQIESDLKNVLVEISSFVME